MTLRAFPLEQKTIGLNTMNKDSKLKAVSTHAIKQYGGVEV
jgi:hypothetical protein